MGQNLGESYNFLVVFPTSPVGLAYGQPWDKLPQGPPHSLRMKLVPLSLSLIPGLIKDLKKSLSLLVEPLFLRSF